jgi:HAE1 family hydrophobic/amphiphilic exporter-1
VDSEAAATEGLTETGIAQTVSQATQGSTVTEVNLDGEQRDVTLQLDSEVTSADDLRNLELSSTSGETVQLRDVADVLEFEAPTVVTRTEGERTATVTATATGENTGSISTDLQNRLDQLDLPQGASYSLGGVTADQNEAFASLGLALLAAILIVYIVMVGTFRSLIQPVILMVSIPFAATGSVILLLLTGTALGVAALIGALMLVGIVVTNAIVLLDLVHQYRVRGMDARTAVIEGGRRRLRPILMTAIATICALMPMALGLTGSSGFISQPLAIVVIGGLATSTVLTLVLVPVLYTIVEDFGERSKKRRERRRARREEKELEKLERQAQKNGYRANGLSGNGASANGQSQSSPEPEGQAAGNQPE